MNKNKIIIFVIVVIIGIVYFVTRKPVNPTVITREDIKPETIENKEMCYFKETKGEINSDFAFTSVKYNTDGTSVSGIINWIPGEKDSLVGAYSGNVLENTDMQDYPVKLDILYRARGEGILNTQQEIIIVGRDGIKTGIGEKYASTDGTYIFKDPAKLSYDNFLPVVDCASVPERFKTNYLETKS